MIPGTFPRTLTGPLQLRPRRSNFTARVKCVVVPSPSTSPNNSFPGIHKSYIARHTHKLTIELELEKKTAASAGRNPRSWTKKNTHVKLDLSKENGGSSRNEGKSRRCTLTFPGTTRADWSKRVIRLPRFFIGLMT